METQNKIMEAIAELRKQHPSWQFGQPIANPSIFAKGPTNSAVWDVEDEEFLKAAESHLALVQEKQQEAVAA